MAKATTKTVTPIDYTLGATATIETKRFVDDELRQYSAHSNVRGIPFLGDGMKQAQRKAIYGFLCRGENADKDTVERIAAMSASCFTGEIPVLLHDETHLPIEELVTRFRNGEAFYVKAFNGERFENSKVVDAFPTKDVTELVEIEIGESLIRCTPEHLFLTERGWIEAQSLTLDDSLVGFSETSK